MSERIKERNEIEEKYKWDLSTLFESDEAWEASYNEIDEEIKALARFEGELDNADTLYEAFLESEKVSIKIENLIGYANLRHSEDTRDEKGNNMSLMAYSKAVEYMSITAYMTPEILSRNDEVLKSFIENEKLKDYKFYLEDLLRQKAHTLSTNEEYIIAAMGEALATPWQASEALMDADMKFEDAVDSEGKKYALSNNNFVFLENSKDRVLRESAFRNFYETYKNHNYTLASTFNGAIKKATAEAKVRKYTSSRNMEMDSDNIPEFVYDNLIETIHKHINLMHRYASLRKRLLEVDELHYYDVYTPLVQDINRLFTYEEAQEIILKALEPMGEEYLNTVKSAFESRWIDVYPNMGKSSGAYSAGTYESNPYILCNFTGTLDTVSTLAHEMGHSMHSYYTRKTQPYHYSNYTMFVAEVASTVNENLLIEYLLKNESDPKIRLSLLNQYMEGFKGTVYRQTMFCEFEKEAHAMSERGEPITAEALNSKYYDLVKYYFGDDLVMDDEIQYEWSRIPHFYNPFYVYVYATGYSSAVALSQKILNEGDEAVKKYIEFLSMGNSRYPLDELMHAGVDWNTPAPIENALKKFEAVLDEAETILEHLN